ncbi:hypothetical protein OHC33_004741 [Knufia fluminis]|uniref:Uncharacterized protein n=1 Tax=Knufia fluminis TaxID=191047 RepID=A0AAN8EF59_9EURO|nr:hypothetical protein OHC33_004741 [Knufia fluminis]
MYRSHNRKSSRIQHLASLGWILEDNNSPSSPTHQLNKSLELMHSSHAPQTEAEQSQLTLRGRALSINDVPSTDSSAANSPVSK